MPIFSRITGLATLSLFCVHCSDAASSTPTTGGNDGGATPDPIASDAGGEPTNGDAGSMTEANGFTFMSKAAESCPLSAAACASWPAAANGLVELYTSMERFEGKSFARTFHVYTPAGVSAKVPLVLAIHGGTGSGPDFLVGTPIAQMFDARGASPGVAWQKNTDTCKRNGNTFVDGSGAACQPQSATAFNAQRAIVVYPDGVADPGTANDRHWEDGRSPSPGNSMLAQQRNDVGYIDHILSVMLSSGLPIDPEAVYVMGVSNGGMMTQRLVCNAANTAYPNLGKVAGFAAAVAALPEPLAKGTDGREKCTDQPAAITPLMLVVGKEVPTPDCATWPCRTPTVSGDGTMPYGTAGSSHYVHSPDKGRVLSSIDTQALWLDRAGGGSGHVDATENIGFFTTRKTSIYRMGSDFEVLESVGGTHQQLGARSDTFSIVRMWRFVSAHRRSAQGTLSHVDPTWVSGEY